MPSTFYSYYTSSTITTDNTINSTTTIDNTINSIISIHNTLDSTTSIAITITIILFGMPKGKSYVQ